MNASLASPRDVAGGRTLPAHKPVVELGRALQRLNYRFTTATPLTHARYLARRQPGLAKSVRDVFGWNMPFDPALLPPEVRAYAEKADVFVRSAAGVRSTVRFSTTGAGQLFVHSAFAEGRDDMVFFGPDSYRFLAWIDRWLDPRSNTSIATLIDLGCGSGVGGIHAARRVGKVLLTDLNPRALAFARINAELAEQENVELRQADLLNGIDEPLDVIVANPPYMMDPTGPTYRNGGEHGGAALSLRIVDEALRRLDEGGRLILYTASTFVDGQDTFLSELLPRLNQRRLAFEYVELDPDVFGEELEKPGYEAVERIAVVGLFMRMEDSRPRAD